MAGSSNISGDESIIFADNASFDGTERGGKMTTDGQLWIGATASPHVRLGSLTSGAGITVTNGAGTITVAADTAGLNFATHADMTIGTSTTLIVNPDDSTFYQQNPTTIGSGTPNTGAFTSLTSNSTQTFSASTNVFPVTTSSATSTGYASPDVIFKQVMLGAVPGSILAGFGSAFEMYAHNTAGTQTFQTSLFSGWDITTPASESSHATIRVREAGSNVDGFRIYGTYVQMPLGQVVSVTTPGVYPYTTLKSDYVILVDTSSARTINLIASPLTGQTYRIKDNVGSAATNNITITPTGKNVDGSASTTINVAYGSVDVVFGGTEWHLV